jgi:hypothetical protein
MGKSVKEGVMPREVIHSNSPEFEPFRLSVGWQADCDVQVGIQVENTDHDLTGTLLRDETHRVQLGEKVEDFLVRLGLDRPDYRDSDTQHSQRIGFADEVLGLVRETRDYVERDGVWVSMSRSQINATIRALKKARNSAYGKDE